MKVYSIQEAREALINTNEDVMFGKRWLRRNTSAIVTKPYHESVDINAVRDGSCT